MPLNDLFGPPQGGNEFTNLANAVGPRNVPNMGAHAGVEYIRQRAKQDEMVELAVESALQAKRIKEAQAEEYLSDEGKQGRKTLKDAELAKARNTLSKEKMDMLKEASVPFEQYAIGWGEIKDPEDKKKYLGFAKQQLQGTPFGKYTFGQSDETDARVLDTVYKGKQMALKGYGTIVASENRLKGTQDNNETRLTLGEMAAETEAAKLRVKQIVAAAVHQAKTTGKPISPKNIEDAASKEFEAARKGGKSIMEAVEIIKPLTDTVLQFKRESAVGGVQERTRGAKEVMDAVRNPGSAPAPKTPPKSSQAASAGKVPAGAVDENGTLNMPIGSVWKGADTKTGEYFEGEIVDRFITPNGKIPKIQLKNKDGKIHEVNL